MIDHPPPMSGEQPPPGPSPAEPESTSRFDRRTARRLERSTRRRRSIGADHALGIAYEGAHFGGYARQPGQLTVEGCLRAALEPIAPGLRRIAVAGRTDRGVSASGQVVSFRSDEALPATTLAEAIDRVAPGALACLSAGPAPRGFHAQFWAVARSYVYLHPATDEDLRLQPRLDRLMRALVGTRSFHAYARQTPPGTSPVRKLWSSTCTLGHVGTSPVLVFELTANGFLRRMVRVVVATALAAARRGAPEDRLVALAETEDRAATEPPAAPEPLRLVRVRYPGWSPLAPPL